MNRSIPMAVVLVAAAVSASAEVQTNEYESAGVVWTYTVKDASKKTVSLIGGCSLDNSTPIPTSEIPWTFTDKGTNYTVVAISGFSSKANSLNTGKWLTGVLDIPDAVTSVGSFEGLSEEPNSYITGLILGTGVTKLSNYQFKNNRKMTFALIKGKLTSAGGSQTFGWCYKMKNVILLKNGTGGTVTGILNNFNNTGGTIFISPDTYGTDVDVGDAGYTPVYLDLTYDAASNALTAYPATADAFTNAIACAKAPFKSVFGFDTIVSCKNRIADPVSIAESQLSDVSAFQSAPWFMTWAVKTQAQLNTLLGKVDVNSPFIVDITGAREEIAVPDGNRVAVLASEGKVINCQPCGMMILFK